MTLQEFRDKHKTEPSISQDGNQVCALLGINLQEGIAGFGDTLEEALSNLDEELLMLP